MSQNLFSLKITSAMDNSSKGLHCFLECVLKINQLSSTSLNDLILQESILKAPLVKCVR